MGVIFGCAATTPFQKADFLEGKGIVYVFRPESLLSRGTIISVYVGNEKRGLLINNSYLPLQVTPGSIEITLRTNDFVKNKYDSIMLKDVKAGEEYFIKANPGLLGAFTLVKLDRNSGVTEIGKTNYYRTK